MNASKWKFFLLSPLDQINYLGHCLIALELLSLMNKSGDDIRIVQVSSVAHTFGKLDFDNIQGNKNYSRILMYGNSKLYQVRIYSKY